MREDPFEESLRTAVKSDAFIHERPPTAERVQLRIQSVTKSTQRWRGVWSLASTAAILLIAIGALAILRPPNGGPSGSGVAVRTQAPLSTSETPPPCPAGELRGQLIADEAEGVVILEESGLRRPVIWPHGYVARLNAGDLELLNERGQAVAHEGDQMVIGGGEHGEGPDPPWLACGGIDVVETPSDQATGSRRPRT